ncbi:MAG: hypothetical protein V7641_2765 [Blastocatellia bacterium]
MSNANLERVIEEVKALPPDDLRKVKVLIDSLLQAPSAEVSLEDQLDQLLLEAGVISEIPKRLPRPEHLKDFKPIEVKGKPISETIIEERR